MLIYRTAHFIEINAMKFYGIQKITLIDYPGEVATTVFTFGCNFKCPYCHNPELVKKSDLLKPIEWSEILEYLKKRKNVLGGVCVTGGEPLMHEEIINVVNDVHSIGLKVKIDTNGSYPEMLKKIKPDYIAMDIKTSLKKYNLVADIKDVSGKIKESIDYIINSGIPHEFRTTVVPGIVDEIDIKEIAGIIKNANSYILAQFRNDTVLDTSYKNVMPYPIEKLQEMQRIVLSYGINCEVRGSY
jgi:pyruvate formate lyase activating enzyme